MTELLEKAIAEVSKLSGEEQDRIASLLLLELEDQRAWDQAFASTQDQLASLADEAAKERLMSRHRYELIIYWSKDDDAFVAEVPELAGCAADGATYAEAVANVQVVIDEWIQTAKELGRDIPEPKGRLLFA